MSPPSRSRAGEQQQQQPRRRQQHRRPASTEEAKTKDNNLGDEFDVVESDPDIVSSSSSDEDSTPEAEAKTLDKKEPAKDDEDDETADIGSFASANLSEGSPEMAERMRKIRSIRISFGDALSCLDMGMLKTFCLIMSAFFGTGAALSLLFLIGVYFFHEDLWYEYFPVPDSGFVQHRDEL